MVTSRGGSVRHPLEGTNSERSQTLGRGKGSRGRGLRRKRREGNKIRERQTLNP